MTNKGESIQQMKKVKLTVIWTVVMLVWFIICNIGGALFVKKIALNHFNESMKGYSSKIVFPLEEPTDEKAAIHNSSIMLRRSILSNDTLESIHPFWYSAFFANYTIDESYIFKNKDGETDFSEGIFAHVYLDKKEGMDPHKNGLGLIDVRKLAQNDGIDDIRDALADNSGAVVKVDRYALDGYEVIPASLTVTDSQGQTIITKEFPAKGELIDSDDTFIYNDSNISNNSPHDLYMKIVTAQQGERPCDKAAKSLAASIPFDKNEYSKGKTSYGITRVNYAYTEVNDGHAMIFTYTLNYRQGVAFHMAVFGVIFTLIFVLVCRRRR